MLVFSGLVLSSKRNSIELCYGHFLRRLGRLHLVPSLFRLGPLGWNDDHRGPNDAEKMLVLNHHFDGLVVFGLFPAMILRGGFPLAHVRLVVIDDPEFAPRRPAHVDIDLDPRLQALVTPGVSGAKTCSTVVVLFSTCLQFVCNVCFC